MIKRFYVVSSALLMFLSMHQIARAELLLDRGLPADHINDPSGEMRANIRWAGGFDNRNFYGDDFVIGEVGDRYVINHVRTWAVLGYRDERPAKPDELGDWFSQVRLLGGIPTDEFLPVLVSGSLALNDSMTDNPNVVISRVTYPDAEGSSYNNFGPRTTLWQIDFYNLNWVIEGGRRYNFVVQGTGRQVEGEEYFHAWYNHATSAQFDSVPQQGADDLMLVFSGEGEFVRIAEAEEHWDKPSDINIQVFGERLEADAVITPTSPVEPAIVSIARALCDVDLLTGLNCQTAIINAEQGNVDRRSQLLQEVVDEATGRFRSEHNIPPNALVLIEFEGPLTEAALMQLHDLLDQLNQTGVLSERVYAQLQTDLNEDQISVPRLYNLALDRMLLFEALDPARVAPILDRFYDAGMISASGRHDLLAALDAGSLNDPIEFLQYMDQAVVFDLRNYPNQPEAYFLDIHQAIAEMLLETGLIVGMSDFNFEFVLRSNQFWQVILESLEAHQIDDDRLTIPNRYDVIVSTQVGDRYYEHINLHRTPQSEEDFLGRLDLEELVNLFNKIFRDQASDYRLHTVVPSYSYYDSRISADRDSRFGVLALTETQAQIYFNRASLQLDPAAELTSDRIEEILTLFEQIGLVGHLSAEQIAAARDRIARQYITGPDELLAAFDDVLLRFEWESGNIDNPYQALTEDFAAISRGYFAPTQITNEFDWETQTAAQTFVLNGIQYSQKLEFNGDWLDPQFFEFIQSVAAQAVSQGQFYPIYDRYGMSGYLFLTDDQYAALQTEGLFQFQPVR